MRTNEILKSLRQAKRLTQNDIAKDLGVSLSSYQKYERDKNCITPSLDVLERIADYYKVTVDFLLGRASEEEQALNLLSAEYNLTDLEKKILYNYLSLPEKYRSLLFNYLRGMLLVTEEEIKNAEHSDGD